MVDVGNEYGSEEKKNIFEKRVLEISKRVRFVLMTLAFDSK